jgi:hypothetical protein
MPYTSAHFVAAAAALRTMRVTDVAYPTVFERREEIAARLETAPVEDEVVQRRFATLVLLAAPFLQTCVPSPLSLQSS